MLRDQLDDTRGQRDKWEQAAQMALRQLSAPESYTSLVVADPPGRVMGLVGVRRPSPPGASVMVSALAFALLWANALTEVAMSAFGGKEVGRVSMSAYDPKRT